MQKWRAENSESPLPSPTLTVTLSQPGWLHVSLPTAPSPWVILGKSQASYDFIPLHLLTRWLCIERCLCYSFPLPSVPGGLNPTTSWAAGPGAAGVMSGASAAVLCSEAAPHPHPGMDSHSIMVTVSHRHSWDRTSQNELQPVPGLPKPDTGTQALTQGHQPS